MYSSMCCEQPIVYFVEGKENKVVKYKSVNYWPSLKFSYFKNFSVGCFQAFIGTNRSLSSYLVGDEDLFYILELLEYFRVKE